MALRLEFKPTPGQRRTLIGVSSIIGALAVYSWAIRPHVDSLRAAQRYERAMTERVDLREGIEEDLLAQRERLATLRAERATFSAMAFSPAEAVQFHSDLQAICHEAACRVAWLNYGRDESVARYGERGATSAMVIRSASLTIHGTYGNVTRFLEVLRTRPQKVWIDSFEITVLPSEPDRVVCDMMITICVDQEKGNAPNDF